MQRVRLVVILNYPSSEAKKFSKQAAVIKNDAPISV